MLDVIVIGSGPAGVSASFPLVASGMRVLMIDGGKTLVTPPPEGSYLNLRSSSQTQHAWMIGDDFHALRQLSTVSPKLRTPTQRETFSGFASANRIVASDFVLVGSLAKGGLSNAWGCGVATFDSEELSSFPFDPNELRESYRTVGSRIGLSGANDDDLSAYFGVDSWAQPPLPLDALHTDLLKHYQVERDKLVSRGFSLGRSRVAALSMSLEERQACDLSGACLWGCHRNALYNATQDLERLIAQPNFTYAPGFIVDSIRSLPGSNELIGPNGTLSGKSVVLAAGTMASTAIAMRTLHLHTPVAVQASPTAAFMIWLPKHLGASRQPAFGLGQLSFSLRLDEGITTFGSTFSTAGLPVAEFARHLPLGRRQSVDVLAHLLSSCLAGNIFFPGSLSRNTATLRADGTLHVKGAFSEKLSDIQGEARGKLSRALRALGAWMLPGSFTPARPGADIHYAASLPMVRNPVPGQCDAHGALVGCHGIYVADGASLPCLPAKSHTLTIMANADRIGRGIARRHRTPADS